MIIERTAGYYVYVQSWENDGDNYQSATVKMDSLDKARALVKLLTLFETSDHEGGIGNIPDGFDCPLELIQDTMDEFLEDNPEIMQQLDLTNAKIEGNLYNWLVNLKLLYSGDYITRVASKVEIRDYPRNVLYDIVE